MAHLNQRKHPLNNMPMTHPKYPTTTLGLPVMLPPKLESRINSGTPPTPVSTSKKLFTPPFSPHLATDIRLPKASPSDGLMRKTIRMILKTVRGMANCVAYYCSGDCTGATPYSLDYVVCYCISVVLRLTPQISPLGIGGSSFAANSEFISVTPNSEQVPFILSGNVDLVNFIPRHALHNPVSLSKKV